MRQYLQREELRQVSSNNNLLKFCPALCQPSVDAVNDHTDPCGPGKGSCFVPFEFQEMQVVKRIGQQEDGCAAQDTQPAAADIFRNGVTADKYRH